MSALARLSPRQEAQLRALGRVGETTWLEHRLLCGGPWFCETRAALVRRGLIDWKPGQEMVRVTRLGRMWLNLHPETGEVRS
jgi:hypothetical protein